MLFNSLIFIFIFFPLTLLGWYLLHKLPTPIPAKLFILAMSFWFYGYYNPKYLCVLIGSITINYVFSFAISRLEKHELTRKFFFIFGIVLNLGLLFYLKYFNFFIENCNVVFHSSIQVEKIALPLGISFFTFQQISYITDVYKRSTENKPFIDYACYIAFFPQLIAGPIVLEDEFFSQWENAGRSFNTQEFVRGFSFFTLGLSKKVLLADALAVLVDKEYSNIAFLDAPCAWAIIIFFMLQLYFDFSGYCDMAKGLGKMLGIELPDNFNSPLLAVSVRDFWRRWHITLGRFFTKYVYIPMGGNRKGKVRQCLNLFIVFMLSGIWHGANWTFIVWGLMHAIGAVSEVAFPKTQLGPKWFRRIITGIYITLSFSIFRADSLKDAWLLWQKLFAGGFHGSFVGMCNQLNFKENYLITKFLGTISPTVLNISFIAIFFALLMVSLALVCGKRNSYWIEKEGMTRRFLLICAFLFVYSVFSLSEVSTFLYFNF